ncbi:metallophosphoesterase [Coraliomargarita parva]|uniref:metallophosphoesterase n=1 Tax=Coraliomargarita parva TaxID=3014050 RepID=UPI0022B57172|nr:metallophosphoesterase [Coraliomargarita parva]
MAELTQLGMTDVASRKRSGFFFVAGGLSTILIVLYVFLRNAIYVSRGMLKPDFELIRKAYDFNLWELPLTLVGLALFIGVLGVTRPGIRRSASALCGIFLFLAADLFALRYYVTRVEPEKIVLRHVRLETPKLAKPVRLLHISDIQSGGIAGHEQNLFEQIQALQPDLVLFTGDFLQPVAPATFDSEWPKLLSLFKSLSPKYGIYAVYGDTEYEPGIKFYRLRGPELEPLHVLSTGSAQIDTGAGKIDILGLNLFHSKEPKWAMRSIEDWMAKSDAKDFRVVMGHAPDYALETRELPIDLCLAGHTHGGQVRLPWYGPLVIDSEVPKEWSRGFRRIGVPYLNVSAGAGSNRYRGLPPIRFLCPTEMTLIELLPMRSIR